MQSSAELTVQWYDDDKAAEPKLIALLAVADSIQGQDWTVYLKFQSRYASVRLSCNLFFWLVFSTKTVFFSHDKSVRTVFRFVTWNSFFLVGTSTGTLNTRFNLDLGYCRQQPTSQQGNVEFSVWECRQPIQNTRKFMKISMPCTQRKFKGRVWYRVGGHWHEECYKENVVVWKEDPASSRREVARS